MSLQYRLLSLHEINLGYDINYAAFDEAARENVREELNRDRVIIDYLRDKGFAVRLFDGYDDDLTTKLWDPVDGAHKLSSVIKQFEADALVYDLNYWGNFTYGLDMLSVLRGNEALSGIGKIIVYSYFIDERPYEFKEKLTLEFGIPQTLIKYVLRCPMSDVAKLLNE